jgi:hypothetical protein
MTGKIEFEITFGFVQFPANVIADGSTHCWAASLGAEMGSPERVTRSWRR